MKQLFVSLIFCVASANATTWFATSSGVNISTTSLWVPTSTGSCTGSGTALVWASRAAGDIFVANGCTTIALNADPGVNGKVTITTSGNGGTDGGSFTYASATNITLNIDVVAGTTLCLTATGSTGKIDIIGNVTGGSGSTHYGINDAHTVITATYTGTFTGGSGGSSHGINLSGTGAATITGSGVAGSIAAANGINATTNNTTVTGNCTGSDSVVAFGCANADTNGNTLTIIGSVINGKKGTGWRGGIILYNPAVTDYMCIPKDSSYAIGSEDCTHTGGGAGLSTHAIEMPLAPSITNVKSGTPFGSLTGTYASCGPVACSFQ